MDDAGIYAADAPYLERYVQIGVAGEKVIAVSFPNAPPEDAGDDHPVLDRILAYLEGVKDDFSDVEIGLTVPTEHRDVLDTVRQIPYGEQLTVNQLVTKTPGLDPDDDASADTVREALAENPLPLIVPDHRVRDGPSGAPPDIEQKLRSLEGL